VLLECYDEKEMERAIRTDADVLGINNRDLQTLKVDLNRTGNIVKKFGKGIGKPLISESGVRNRADVEFLMGCGVKGILVGTAIWKADDIGKKIRELKGDS
jgi:indole-3-glycerol phosphate synthase